MNSLIEIRYKISLSRKGKVKCFMNIMIKRNKVVLIIHNKVSKERLILEIIQDFSLKINLMKLCKILIMLVVICEIKFSGVIFLIIYNKKLYIYYLA